MPAKTKTPDDPVSDENVAAAARKAKKTAKGPTAKGKTVAQKAMEKSNTRVASNRKHDYERAREMFVQGSPKDPSKPDGDRDWLNLKELAEALDIPYQRIRQRASKERWTDLRSAHQVEVARTRAKKRAEFLASEAVEFDNKALNIAKTGIQLIGIRMAEVVSEVKVRQERRKEALIKVEQGLPVEKWELAPAINSMELERLAKSAQVFQEIGMRALGTDIERHQIDVSGGLDINGEVQHTISVQEELQREDPDRLAGFVMALDRAGIFQQIAALEAGVDPNIIDADVVEEQDAEEQQ